LAVGEEMSTIEIRDLNKKFGSVIALDKVSLSFHDGEFFGLLGPSGSGKTTLLRCIAGLVEADSGAIAFDSEDVRGIPTHRRNIGMVFQNYALFPHMSVFANIAFGLSVRHRSKEEIAERVASLLRLVRLGGYEARRPQQLSGGQQQRVALARALSATPRVLLLDEPLGALDKRLRQQMQTELKQIQKEVGITTVFVTHDQEEALALCGRIAIFNNGKVVQCGRPSEVYERPNTAFAAEFLGAANLLTGYSKGRAGGLGRIAFESAGEIFTEDPLPEVGANATVVMRPEKLLVAAIGEAKDEDCRVMNKLVGTIKTVSYLGSNIVYAINTVHGEFTVFQQNRDRSTLSLGERVTISWDPRYSVVIRT